MISRFLHYMAVTAEGGRQRGEVVARFRGLRIEWQYHLKVAGSSEKLSHGFEVFTLSGSGS